MKWMEFVTLDFVFDSFSCMSNWLLSYFSFIFLFSYFFIIYKSSLITIITLRLCHFHAKVASYFVQLPSCVTFYRVQCSQTWNNLQLFILLSPRDAKAHLSDHNTCWKASSETQCPFYPFVLTTDIHTQPFHNTPSPFRNINQIPHTSQKPVPPAPSSHIPPKKSTHTHIWCSLLHVWCDLKVCCCCWPGGVLR